MSKIHCFYHSADLDGHCSGAIVKYKFPEAIMHPINYGEEFPWEVVGKEDTVFMVDFCLQPWSEMERLGKLCPAGLIWIDHHKSAIDQYNPESRGWRGILDTDCAACELVWLYLFPDRPVPLAVKLLSLYDSWTYQGHELEEMVLPFQMRMRMERLDPRDWEDGAKWISLFQEDLLWIPSDRCTRSVEWLIEEGKLLLRYDEEQKRKYVQTYGFETCLVINHQLGPNPTGPQERYKAIAVNLGHTNSKVFDSVWRRRCSYCSFGEVNTLDGGTSECPVCEGTGYIEPYDLMITFVRRSNHKWNVSLYSTKEDIDCGAIAKSFGGGGHKGAAGFQCEELPFDY